MDCKGIYHIICNSDNAEKHPFHVPNLLRRMHQGVNQQMLMKREDFSSKDSWRRGFSSTFSGHSVAPKDFGAIKCGDVAFVACHVGCLEILDSQKSLKDRF